jgi:hypothetical protein
MQERDRGTMKEERGAMKNDKGERKRLHHRDTENTENGHKDEHGRLLRFKER